jgi:N-acetylglucosaminyl-diphospho-decaprenol L-rhamnosyltransferase
VSSAQGRIAAVVVDYHAGAYLAECVRSLLEEGVVPTVVENGDPAAALSALAAGGLEAVPLLVTGRNLGYGAGINRGLAAAPRTEYVLVCNPDLVVHAGALARLAAAFDNHPGWAVVGPRILTPDGRPYPSARLFPAPLVAAGHALLGAVAPDNPFTRRYRTPDLQDRAAQVDWVSGACFLARRDALEEVGGFDEQYFMFAEDMDLCWRLSRLGWRVGFEPAAVVTHHEGISRRGHPYTMTLAHHRSALRFAARTLEGRKRALLPLVAVVLAARLGAVWTTTFLRRARARRPA